MNPDTPQPRSSPGPSWPLLIAIAVVICGTAALMADNSYYMVGEIISLLYLLAVALSALSVLVGFRNRTRATWLVVTTGGSLILWQACESRRWGILQEEVMSILNHARREKSTSGANPASLDSYPFRHPETRSHIGYHFREGKLVVSYALNGSGANFLHHEDEGFYFNE